MGLKECYKILPEIDTERLKMRNVELNDSKDLARCTADKEVYKYWGREPNHREMNPETVFIETQRKSFRKNELYWGIELKEEGRLIGDISIFEIENSRIAKVAYRIAKNYWGNGFTTEALIAIVRFCFRNTELQRIWSDVMVDNIGSVRVMEKSGFTREGMIRQGKMVYEYCNYYIFGILKDDINGI